MEREVQKAEKSYADLQNLITEKESELEKEKVSKEKREDIIKFNNERLTRYKNQAETFNRMISKNESIKELQEIIKQGREEFKFESRKNMKTILFITTASAISLLIFTNIFLILAISLAILNAIFIVPIIIDLIKMYQNILKRPKKQLKRVQENAQKFKTMMTPTVIQTEKFIEELTEEINDYETTLKTVNDNIAKLENKLSQLCTKRDSLLKRDTEKHNTEIFSDVPTDENPAIYERKRN